LEYGILKRNESSRDPAPSLADTKEYALPFAACFYPQLVAGDLNRSTLKTKTQQSIELGFWYRSWLRGQALNL
jgi:hypothetical protein